MAAAADEALAAVLRHCRVAALLPPLALPLVADRSVKLRHCCAVHLLRVWNYCMTCCMILWRCCQQSGVHNRCITKVNERRG